MRVPSPSSVYLFMRPNGIILPHSTSPGNKLLGIFFFGAAGVYLSSGRLLPF